MKGSGKILVTMGEIVEYTGRSKKTIMKWKDDEGFPAVKVDGRWESNTELIDAFQKKRIENKCGVA